jgi:hypothetical protein
MIDFCGHDDTSWCDENCSKPLSLRELCEKLEMLDPSSKEYQEVEAQLTEIFEDKNEK